MTDATLNKVDARTQSSATLLERRQLAVRLHQGGVPVMQIVSQSRLSWGTVNAAINRHAAGGQSALVPAKPGRKQGTGRSLTGEQEAEIRQFIFSRRPVFYGLDHSLWSRDAVARLIALKLELELSVRGISNYLTRWGITLKNPSKGPYDRCARPVKTWLDVNYAEIERQGQEAHAQVYWINRPVALDAAHWCPTMTAKNQASDSNVAAGPARKRLMVSAVSQQGTLRWAVIYGPFNAEQQIKFVAGLVKDTIGRRKQPLFLMCSDLTLCASQDFENWLNKQLKVDIRVFPDLRRAP